MTHPGSPVEPTGGGLDVSGRRCQVQSARGADASDRTTGRCTAQGDMGYSLLCGKIA
jgi:hypothetical protein